MSPATDLQGKVCLITGGSRGLGLSMASSLGLAGSRVVITARKSDELEQARGALSDRGIDVFSFCHDLSDIESSVPLVDKIADEVGDIDVLINNAGATWGAPASEVDWRGWQKVMDVNLNGTWALTQAVAKKCMLPRKTGSIINVASVAGLFGVAPGATPTVAYCTSKAGQINLTRALAGEWGRYNVRVNALLPGWFPTKMAKDTIEEHSAHYLARIPLGRFGDTETDLEGPILFLASNASKYVTGQTLTVDGGLTSVI
jgi:NAD(P)-dependent dehydrogenase (short-subunit alcohol dehydrogenase family)